MGMLMNNPMLSIKIFEEKFLSIISSKHFDISVKLSMYHFIK